MELLGGLLQFLALLSLLFPFYLLGRGVWELREFLGWSSYTAQQVVVSHHGVLLPLPEEQSPWHLRCGPSANLEHALLAVLSTVANSQCFFEEKCRCCRQ